MAAGSTLTQVGSLFRLIIGLFNVDLSAAGGGRRRPVPEIFQETSYAPHGITVSTSHLTEGVLEGFLSQPKENTDLVETRTYLRPTLWQSTSTIVPPRANEQQCLQG